MASHKEYMVLIISITANLLIERFVKKKGDKK